MSGRRRSDANVTIDLAGAGGRDDLRRGRVPGAVPVAVNVQSPGEGGGPAPSSRARAGASAWRTARPARRSEPSLRTSVRNSARLPPRTAGACTRHSPALCVQLSCHARRTTPPRSAAEHSHIRACTCRPNVRRSRHFRRGSAADGRTPGRRRRGAPAARTPRSARRAASRSSGGCRSDRSAQWPGRTDDLLGERRDAEGHRRPLGGHEPAAVCSAS